MAMMQCEKGMISLVPFLEMVTECASREMTGDEECTM